MADPERGYGGCTPLWISKYRKSVKKKVKTGEKDRKKRETAIYLIYFFNYYVCICLDANKEIFPKMISPQPLYVAWVFLFPLTLCVVACHYGIN